MNKIIGLSLYLNIITEDNELKIINALDQNEWSNSLSRRTQHYGYIYDYKSKNANIKGNIFLPELENVAQWLENNNIMTKPTQCIINEYTQNQYISKHIDSPLIFGPIIVSLSLGEDTNFYFINTETKEKIEIEVPRRSLLILKDEARYKWTHEIPKRKTYILNGNIIKKRENYRRISLTFRTMK